MWNNRKRRNSHGFVTLQFETFSKICAITMGRKKTSLKHCYLHGIVTCPYFLGPENGVRFLRRFSFRCGTGCIFVALFVKSSFGTFCCDLAQVKAWGIFQPPLPLTTILHDQSIGVSSAFAVDTAWNVWSLYRSSPFRIWNTSYITGLDMCKVCTEAVLSVALWTRVTLQVWTCVKYVPKQSIL